MHETLPIPHHDNAEARATWIRATARVLARAGSVDVVVRGQGSDEVRQGLVEVLPAGHLVQIRADDSGQACIEVSKRRGNRVVVERDGQAMDLGVQHAKFQALLDLCRLRDGQGEALNVWLAGPAGSGKTTAARNVARALGLPFMFNGAIDAEHKLLGFQDAQGRVVRRPFREAFEHGGVYLFDEVDGSHPSALLPFNAAISIGQCDFPDAIVSRHPDCIVIAAANTYGQGATHDYVGRLKQDQTFLDRFIQMAWGYDDELEEAIAGNSAWVKKVQAIRQACDDIGIRHVVSPRASIQGAAMLKGGFDEATAMDLAVRKGLPLAEWTMVLEKAGL